MSVTVSRVGEAAVVGFAGEIDMATSQQARAAVQHGLDSGPAVLVVDLTAVSFLSSTGLAVLVHAQQAAGDRISVRVVAADRVVRRPIELTGLDKTLAVFASLPEALAGTGRLGQP